MIQMRMKTMKTKVKQMSEDELSNSIFELREQFIEQYIDDNPNNKDVIYYNALSEERINRQ